MTDHARVSEYAFGTRTAQFHVCTVCGVVPLVTSGIDSRLYAVVNVNVLETIEESLLRRAPASFDAEDLNGRLERRRRNWIPHVRFVARAGQVPAGPAL